jgi:phage tail sheath protein FI
MWVPPSVVIAGVFSFNDKYAYEWFAPAGFTRGGLTDVSATKTKLQRYQINDLYDARVNPIASFPQEGIVVWGQKTLQYKASALDRINVRRLLIKVKKYIASVSMYLVFEQNTSATRNRFLNIVNPYLSSVQQKYGLYAFRVIMDDTNNTPDVIDRNIMYGQIYLQPARTSEYIILDFNVLPTGAAFATP